MSRRRRDLAGLLESNGYVLTAKTRLNLVFERTSGDVQDIIPAKA